MALLKEGDQLRGTYEVERFLGEGAFAEVYRVKHRFLGRQALKIFKRKDMTIEEIEEMLGEATLLSRIGHPNIVRVFDANIVETESGVCGYFTMEHVPGGTLDKFWRSHGLQIVPVETSVDLIRQVCRGLLIAHSENPPIIHRDIKPQNILVGYEAEGLRARLSDFGLARQVNPLTLLVSAAGTLAFKPPETFIDSKRDSRAADIFALGVTFYLLLTDQLPYDVNPELGWSDMRAFEKEVLPPSEWNSECNASLDAIVLKCLAREPAARYQSARELLESLEGWRNPVKKVLTPGKGLSSEISKSVLGSHTPFNQEAAKKLARESLRIARVEGRLLEAADMMEEAFNQSPSLRDRYAPQVRLWRSGISM
jgi:serine/threonine-protein kinase